MGWRAAGTVGRWLAIIGAAVVALGALAAWQPLAAINALAAIGSRRIVEGEAYGALPRQAYDLYRPDGVPPAGGWPLVVFFYGGSWNRGDRAEYRFVGEALAANGVLAMVADYRLYPEVRYPDFVRDCAAAVAHALARAGAWGADPRRVLVMGHSAGAYNAAMVALDPRWLGASGHAPSELAGWIGLAGPYDFLPIKRPEVRLAFNHPDVAPDSQPIRHVGQAQRPALLIAARRDDFVDPLRNTRQLADALRESGHAVTLREYEGVDHLSLVGAIAAPLRPLAPVLEDILAFIATVPRTRAPIDQAMSRVSPLP